MSNCKYKEYDVTFKLRKVIRVGDDGEDVCDYSLIACIDDIEETVIASDIVEELILFLSDR